MFAIIGARGMMMAAVNRQQIEKRQVWRDDHCKNQGGVCISCKRRMGGNRKLAVTLDHIIPLSMGGPDTFENTQAMCDECNGQKGNQMTGMETSWRT